ncbi:MAG: hypothetical protein O7B81_10650 [Gammaproteobacteria bacterium]|nr:hypothetical protein [Gammaproteobacteria bacterium]MCZ6890379.1 hypothetical protein [Gammaproteobacteria bacterium]
MVPHGRHRRSAILYLTDAIEDLSENAWAQGEVKWLAQETHARGAG